jgi:hypothetical protein
MSQTTTQTATPARCHKCAQKGTLCTCCDKGWCSYCVQFHPRSK